MTSEEIAAWVQAVGSILAIIAAFLISAIQFKDASKLQDNVARAERKRKYETLTGLIDAALDDYGDTLKALRSSDPNRWFDESSSKELMEEFYQAFLQISPLDMPSTTAVRALVTLRDRLKTAAWNAGTAMDHGTENLNEYLDCVNAMEHNLNEVRTEQQKLLAELAQV
jgi:hypothetical protein